jgi:hypothetical protein
MDSMIERESRKVKLEPGTLKRGAEASFSKTTGNKTLEFGGVSPSNDLTQYKMESFYFYLI